jgi:hypothetical protein
VELARLPFSYSGKKASFMDWGKDDAQLLRAEVQACCRLLAADLSRNLAARITTAAPDAVQLAAAPQR